MQNGSLPAPSAGINRIRFNGSAGASGISGSSVSHPKVCTYGSVAGSLYNCPQQAMSRSVEVFQVDAFTSRPFTGNPAGVVLGADVLDSDEMQAIARELNNGDTTFVCRPQSADHDIAVRFFTPGKEAAFVGHATLAAHAVLQVARAPRSAPPAWP